MGGIANTLQFRPRKSWRSGFRTFQHSQQPSKGGFFQIDKNTGVATVVDDLEALPGGGAPISNVETNHGY